MSDQPMTARRLPVTAEPGRHSIRRESEDLDRAIGQRVRQLRIEHGISQEDLAAAIGVTYQQAHKYEKGVNRISAGRLYAIAQALGVSVNDLVEPFESTPQQRALIDFMLIAVKVPPEKLGALNEAAKALNGGEQ